MQLFKQRGFTLIEMVITVAIIAILAMTAMMSYQHYVTKAMIGEGVRELVTIQNYIEREFARGKSYKDITEYNGQLIHSTNPDDNPYAVYYGKRQIYEIIHNPEDNGLHYTLGAYAMEEFDSRFGDCKILTINDKGEKDTLSGTPKNCW